MTPLAPRRLATGFAATGRGPGAVFLDRDGVLNELLGDGGSPRTLADVRLVDDAHQGVDRLRRAGFLLVVVTNQPDVARGLLDESEALAMTRAVADELDLDDAYVCVHDVADACACRKPQPGLLTAAAHDWGISLADSWLVGDRWVDIAAGNAAGVRTVLLRHARSDDPSGGRTSPPGLVAHVEVTTFDAAVSAITGPAA